jgi:hypothetical protein
MGWIQPACVIYHLWTLSVIFSFAKKTVKFLDSWATVSYPIRNLIRLLHAQVSFSPSLTVALWNPLNKPGEREMNSVWRVQVYMHTAVGLKHFSWLIWSFAVKPMMWLCCLIARFLHLRGGLYFISTNFAPLTLCCDARCYSGRTVLSWRSTQLGYRSIIARECKQNTFWESVLTLRSVRPLEEEGKFYE